MSTTGTTCAAGKPGFKRGLEAGVGDRWIPPLFALVLSFILGTLALDRFAGLSSSKSLAEYTQAVHLISEGFRPEASLVGDGVHLLPVRWSFILYPLGMLAKVFPVAKLLIVTQALALGMATIPLWLLARRVAKLRIGASSALVLAYALHPITHQLATDGFHPESLAIPGFISMAYFGATKRWFWYWVMIAIVLSCRADLGLAVAMWGFVLLGDSERRAGLSTIGVGMVWALGLLLIVQPIVGEAQVAGGQYGLYGESFGDVLLNVVRSPLDFLRDLVAFENVSLLVGLLAPLVFLPLLSLRYLAPTIPLGAIYLVALSSDEAFPERGALFIAFAMIAMAYALRRLGNMGVDRVFLDSRMLTAVVAASALLFVTNSPASPYERPWVWSELSETDIAVVNAAALLEEGDAVLASPSALGVLAERRWLYPLEKNEVPSVAFANFRARAVLIDDRDLPLLSDSQRQAYAEGMEAQGYETRIDDREKRCLAVLPPVMVFTRQEIATWPNAITFARLLCIPVFLWLLFGQENRAAAAWLLAVLGTTDWVDGWIARRFDQASEFGALFDPAVDRFMFLVAIPSLLGVDAISWVLAAIVLFREIVVSSLAVGLDRLGAERLDVTFEGKTGAFMLMFAFPMFLGAVSTLSYADFLGWFAWVFAIPGVIFGLYSLGWQYIPEARKRIAAQRALTD